MYIELVPQKVNLDMHELEIKLRITY